MVSLGVDEFHGIVKNPLRQKHQTSKQKNTFNLNQKILDGLIVHVQQLKKKGSTPKREAFLKIRNFFRHKNGKNLT